MKQRRALKSAMKCGLSYVGDKVYINDAFVHDLFLTGNTGNFSCVELSDCIVQRIDVSFDVSKYCAPHFRRCVFGQIEGRSQNTDLPDGVFEDDCEFEEFVDSAGTTQDILELNLPEGKKVGLTVLRKLFVQKGRGRQSSALHRGLDSRSQRLIPDILRVIERNKFAVPVKAGQNEVWIPDRSKSGRALKMLAGPTASTDPLLEEMANID